MELKPFLLFLILLASSQVNLAQDEFLSCNYQMVGTRYVCFLSIYNPNGLNNFQGINGTHLQNKTNEDVVGFASSTGTSISTNFPSIICETFPNLLSISFVAGMQRINDYSFRGCKIVDSILLPFNQINVVDERSFYENTELQIIDLSENLITEYPENLFINQKKLMLLRLVNNGIRDLPLNLFQPLRNMLLLDMSRNRLSILRNEWFEPLENLIDLNLSENQIEELPPNIFSYSQILNQISMFDNLIRVIHSNSFGVLPSLGYIRLQHNRINAIDELFINNTGISFMQLQNNLCVNMVISDETLERLTMRENLRKCFENFQNLPQGLYIFSSGSDRIVFRGIVHK